MNTYTITEAQRKRLIGAMEEGYMGRKYAEYVEAMEMLQSLAPAPQAQKPHGTQQLRERIANAEPANSYDLAKRADNGGQP